MLEANERGLLFDALRPPDGYRFDQGIGTTYSLDLMALLMAPLAFTNFMTSTSEEGRSFDSLELLESLRRHADRLTLFCQAGRTSIPQARYPQLAFLEESVVECTSRDGGAFHPKLWVLRFIGDGPVRYRVLCLSRNLVFAQSWDTVLALDGEVLDRSRAIAASRPLAAFVEALPQMAARSVSSVVAARAASLGAELRVTRFEPPAGFDDFSFWPLGIEGHRKWPFGDLGPRLLIVSPFLSAPLINELAHGRAETTLVSTVTELERLTSRPPAVQSFYVLNERAQAELEADSTEQLDSTADIVQLRDLHAKLYVTENGRSARIWTGSANATTSAFARNIEFLVELTGPKKLFGIDSMMTPEKNAIRFINLLTPASELVAATGVDADEERLDELLEKARCNLAENQLEARVEPVDDSFNVSIWSPEAGRLHWEPGLSIFCWPSSVARESAVELVAGAGEQVVAVFPKLTRQALTTFFAFEISGRVGKYERRASFVLNLPLIGAPEDRREAVLRSLLQDRPRLMRFLMLMLADDGADIPDFDSVAGSPHADRRPRLSGSMTGGLFEMLLRALDRAPERLDHLETLLAQLRTDAGDCSLPDGFDAIWAPIQASRLARRQKESAT